MRKTHYIPVTADVPGAAGDANCALIRRTIRTALAAEGVTVPCEVDVLLTDDEGMSDDLKASVHLTIKKVSEDIENFSFNTSVAAFMICLNELGECSKREVLEPLTVLLAPFAPHIAEELWAALGHTESVCTASYPVCDETHLVRNSFEYPVSVNGKLRFRKEYAASMTPAEIQADVVTAPEAQKWLEGKTPKKIIVVPGKIINIVI